MKPIPCPLVVGVCLLAGAALADTPPSGSPAPAPGPAAASVARPGGPQSQLGVFAAHPGFQPGRGQAGASGLAGIRKVPALPPPEVQPSGLSGRDDRELRESVAQGQLLAPCALFTKELPLGLRVDALCAPLAPIPGESTAGAEQARFPILSIAW